MRFRGRNFRDDQSGAISVVTAIVLALSLGFAVLAVDLAHLYVVKSELQRAADAGALAGARGLWPNNLPVVLNPPYIPNYCTAQDRALSTATSPSNKVYGAALSAGDVTVEVGNWNYSTRHFTPVMGIATNGVRVRTSKQGVTNLFGRILRTGSLNLSATAIAVMDGAKAVGKGTLPIAISKNWINPGTVITINFTPDPNDNGGWFADPPDRASASTFRDYIVNDSCPPLYVQDIINLQNGQDSSVIQALQDELAAHQAAGVPWDVYLPVVDTEKFNHSQPIDSFVPFRITQVSQGVGLTGEIFGLGEAKGAEPGGPNRGTLAPPKLVY